jgi:glucose/arabinose dehydrogenase
MFSRAISVGVFATPFIFLFAGPTPATAQDLPIGFSPVLVASGLSQPTAMSFAPDGRLFVSEQGGRLRVIKDGQLLPKPFVTVDTDSTNERGLLGIAFDPDFAVNPLVYVYYTATTPKVHNRVARFLADGDQAVPGSEQVVLELDDLSSSTRHNGGAVHFGPDGMLYVSVGENAHPDKAQRLDTLFGKILRLNPDGSIPFDNPFLARTKGKNQAIWARGFRNPFNFAFRRGKKRMYINDVGSSLWEEINRGVAGANYGWPLFEGPESDPKFRPPVYAYVHDRQTGCAITGGTFYDPVVPRYPGSFVGVYFFTDLCGGWIRGYDSSSGAVTPFAEGLSFPVALDVGDDGLLYYLERGTGSVWKVDFTPPPP